MEELLVYVMGLIDKLQQDVPFVAMLLILMGSFRLVFKPITLAIDYYVSQTPDKGDDTKWAEIKESKAFKMIEKVLDFLFSIRTSR